MTDSIVSAGQSTGIRVIDSLSAHEFAVELDGEKVSGVLRISGFYSFKLDVRTTTTLKAVQEPFKLVKMVQRDPNTPFNRWIRESVSAKADIVRPKRTLAIIAVDDGVEIRRWTLHGAWIAEIGYSDFNTGLADLVEESLTIRFDDIEETWAS
ncbi:MAG: hypothetical protein HZC41_03595 [Chloroflexi bacterium]|nr:hypothetical protein [Chloroflexota bacterium]